MVVYRVQPSSHSTKQAPPPAALLHDATAFQSVSPDRSPHRLKSKSRSIFLVKKNILITLALLGSIAIHNQDRILRSGRLEINQGSRL